MLIIVLGVGLYMHLNQKSAITASKGIDFVLDCRNTDAYIEGLYDGNSYEKVQIPSDITITSFISENFKIIGIKEKAFYNFDRIKEISIPQTIAIIEDNAFMGCTGIVKVNYEGTRDEWNQIVIGVGNDALTNVDINFKE